MDPLSYLIVGSGYRSRFFGRIARSHPDLFSAMYLCRSEEKAADLTASTGIPATTREEECLAFHPDFVIIAVDRGHNASVAKTWIEKGFPVMLETPPGENEEQLLELWQLYKNGAKITVSEQYHRYPWMIRGFQAVADGVIGTPSSAYLSLAHDYHGSSLIRRMLLTSGESYVMRGIKLQTPIVPTDSRYGAVFQTEPVQEERDIVGIQFSSGKYAVYDFSGTQYRTFLRSRHLMVRGDRGEWSDSIIYRLDEDGVPTRDFLMPYIPEKYRCLDTQELRDLRKAWRPEIDMDQVQDEFAIASMLLDMREYIAGGPSPYSFIEALDDAMFWLDLQKAAAAGGEAVSSAQMPWHSLV